MRYPVHFPKQTRITKTKFSHKLMAMVLMMTFLPSLMPMNSLYASNSGPTSPEASSFEPVDATDMVNLATGDLSYVLPLLNVPSPEGGYPLALSYHAGIGMDQEASWVGLGWNLNPGSINRNISGVPDDWLETKKYNMLYNNIGIGNSISIGATSYIGPITYASSLSYSSFRAIGGETNYNFGLNQSLGVDFFGSINSYIGTDGVGIGASNNLVNYEGFTSSIGGSVFQSFKGDGLNLHLTTGVGVPGFGVDFDLSSQGNLSSSASIGLSNLSLSSSSSLNGSLHSEASGFAFKFPLPSPGGLTTIDFSYKKTKFWAFDANYAIYNGSLYTGKIEDTYQNLIDPYQMGLDAYEALYDSDTGEQQKDTNFSFMSYDKYNINAQGIGGTISPKLLEEGALIMPRTTIRTVTSSGGSYQIPVTNISYLKPSQSVKNFSKSLDQNNVHFYFENEFSSYLNVGSGNWSLPSPSINYSDPTEFFTTGKIFDDVSIINGESVDSYNEDKERFRQGRYIETFTNEELITSPSKIILPEATGFVRDSLKIPNKGIGAFRVTAIDGKIYHYSLPVYHKEQFSRVSNVEDDSEEKFLEQQQFEPYATHWLLTAVTGSDYIDTNANNQVDKDDYGYWVSFEYGKWSDGFAWRSPNSDHHSNGDTNLYSWGIKEIYYLDKIKTRTHTALFVKEAREDNLSYSTTISNGNDPKYYNIPFERNALLAQDGEYYTQGPHLDIWISGFPPTNYFSTSEFWMYADLVQQKSLRLDKIILLKNEDAENILKQNPNDSGSIYSGRLFAEAKISLIETATGRLVGSKREYISNDHSWDGELYNNVLNTNDIDLSSLMPKSIKTIDFTYDETYPLGRKSSDTIGKLTLNSVTTFSKGGIQLIPPYSFNYYGKNISFVESDIDDWGYYKDEAMMWSLNEITSPLGGTFEIFYENDRYTDEYSKPTTYFDHGLQFKFEGTTSGSKTISFRNNPDVDNEYQIDFTEYFTAGQTTEIDVLFWHFTNTNSNWIGDFAANCTVESVSSNLLVFSLPQLNQAWGRENENCSEKSWVFYDNEYSHVVDMTANWFEEKNENSCERPNQGDNRARYRIYSQKEPLNSAIGGGVRVKELTISSDSNSTTTTYNYIGEDNLESGITSYAPSKRDRLIPYVSELPSPMVIYETVTVEELDENRNLASKRVYQFNVPEPIQFMSGGALVENAFEIKSIQNDYFSNVTLDNEDVDMVFSKYEVKDYSSSIGRLKSFKEYNIENQLIKLLEHNYLASDYNFSQGIIQESFNSYKRLRDSPHKEKYLMTSSSKLKIPNVLSKTTVKTSGVSQVEERLKFDALTGQVIESSIESSDGKLIKTAFIPAYTKYPGMGSKVDAPPALTGNMNMLTQEAMSITEVQKNDGTWAKINATTTSWIPQRYSTTTFVGIPPNEVSLTRYFDVWRKHKSFFWNGAIDVDGYFLNYVGDDDGFDWSGPNAAQPIQWEKISEITKYSDFSVPLEVMDINGNKIGTKMGDIETKIIATANAPLSEMYYSGAEYLDGSTFDDDIGAVGRTTERSHTGKYSIEVASEQGFLTNMSGHRAGKYKISVWASKDNYTNARVYDGLSVKPFNGEKIIAGNWVLLNHYVDLSPSNKIIYVSADTGTLYFDDFRIHPVQSSMTSYVYNERDELSYILGPSNLATQYLYNEAGLLCSTYTEVMDQTEITGGFKIVSSNRLQYKNGIVGNCGTLSGIVPDKIDATTGCTVNFDIISYGEINGWNIDFGDGNSQNGIGDPPATISHSYNTVGEMTVVLTLNGSLTYQTNVSITALPTFTNASDNGNGYKTVTLNGTPGEPIVYSANMGGTSAGFSGYVSVNNVSSPLPTVGSSVVDVSAGVFPVTGSVDCILSLNSSSGGSGSISLRIENPSDCGTVSTSVSISSF